jgi:hypothetical protein
MFRLRKAHQEAFAAAWHKDFAQRMAVVLCAAYPRQTSRMTPTGLSTLIDESIPQAAAFGLHTEAAIACVAELRLLAGEGFAQDPRWEWLTALLRDERYTENERAELALRLAKVEQAPS